MDPRLVGVAVITALLVGGASGALVQSWRYGKTIADMERDQAKATTAAVEKARKEERDARATADDVRGRPVVRVRCYADSPGVPGASTSAGGLPVQSHDPAKDESYEHDLRELVSAAAANWKLKKK